MKQIGITGGIGSGKSIVCQVFSALGVPVYEADSRARWLTEHDPVLRADIIRLLGGGAYTEAGRYNRAYVADRVFADAALLDALNALVHPRVRADTRQWVAAQHPARYVVKEAALMQAAGQGNTLDAVVVVVAPRQVRMHRVRQRDPHRSEADIEAIMARQLSEAARLALADYVLTNDEQTLLLPQIIRLDERFRAEPEAGCGGGS